MAETEKLCEYCTAIDFEQLRLPSSKDVKKLNEGRPIERVFPFIDYFVTNVVTNDDRPHWSLGIQSRIERSAATCSFCREVSRVLETSGVRVKVPMVFEKDPICDVYFTLAGKVEAPPGVTWKRYGPLETSLREFARKFARKHEYLWRYLLLQKPPPLLELPAAIPYPKVSLRWTVPEKHPMPWWEHYPKYEGAIDLFECFQSIEMGMNKPGLFSGRERPALIDMEVPRRWLSDCLENDDDYCAPKLKGESVKASIFRLIDTKTKAVVGFEEHRLGDTPYVTLSYVWGTTQQVMLKRENLLQLQFAGSLTNTTPQTITDAMAFTCDMGYRYLWVDAFCIIQDDDMDKTNQLQIMGDIYKNAVFTIVAAAGENSSSGLAGVRTPRTAIQGKVQVKPAGPQEMPLWLISTVMPHTDYLGSYTSSLPWRSRGWTLQERALSRRVFMFTGEQLLWCCRRCQRWEETNTDTELASLWCSSINEAHVTISSTPWSAMGHEESVTPRDIQVKFWDLVSEFSTSNLCFEGDAHDAFSAILREYTEMTGEQFVWGLPVSEEHFSIALCWGGFTLHSEARDPLVRRECLTTLPTTSLQIKVPFPSWSWLGWKGDIRLHSSSLSNPGEWKLRITPYILRNTPLRLVKVSDIPLDNNTRTMPSSMNDIETASPLPVYSPPIASESLTLDTIYQTLSPYITPERLSRTPDDQLLFFWCERAYLYLVKPAQDSEIIKVQDEKGFRIGSIDQLSGLDDLDGKWEKSDLSEKERMKAEVIAIASYPSNNRSGISWRKKLNLVLFLIKRREGIAYRVAMVDYVPMRQWLKCKRERILVALG